MSTVSKVGRHLDAWVDTVHPRDATGLLKEAYDWQAARLGEPTEFTQLGSLHPHLALERLRLYRAVEQTESGLTEVEKRLAIYLTSVLNRTPHCASGALVALGDLGVPAELVDHVVQDPFEPGTGSERLDAILRYVATLTTAPGSVTEGDIGRLRSVGLSDADVVALNDLSAYYAYVNRVATGLGLRTTVPVEHARNAAPA